MTLKGLARHGAVFMMASCWFNVPLDAHVVDLGTIERPHESFATQLIPSTGEVALADADAAPAKQELKSAMLPGDKRTFYTFADANPNLERPLVLGRNTVRKLYRDVLNIARGPRTETWLALLILLALIGVQLRRTQRLLHHRPLAR